MTQFEKQNFLQVLSAVCAIFLLKIGSLKAQTPPPQDVFPDRDPSPSFPDIPSSPPSELELAPPENLPLPFPENNQTFRITEFTFTGNTRYSDETLAQQFTDHLTQQPLSLSQLVAIATQVAQHYQDNGYVTSGAIIRLPVATQNQGRGKAEIQVIEGELEQITITALASSRLEKDYIHSRLAIASGKPLSLPDLREALQLLQLDPRILTLSARLSQGSQQGKSILDVTYRPAKPLDGDLSFDNGRVPSVGSFQRGIRLNHNNLFGISDRATVNYSNSEGSNLIDVSYSFPLNPQEGTLTLSFSHNDSRVIESPFDDLDIATNSETYEISLRQPLSRTIEEQVFQEFALGLTASFRDSQATLLGEPFPLSPGATADGETRIFALRFFQDYTRRTASNVFALRSQLNFGLNADSTTNEQFSGVERIPDTRFFTWQTQAQYVRLLGESSLFILRGSSQLADQTLFAAEQYSLGGINTVRGYRQDQLLADNGVFLSAELQIPILRAFDEQGILQLAPFFDWGTTWNSSDLDNRDPQSLSAVGLGLQWQYRDRVFLRLDWGIPLVDVEDRDETLQEEGLVFSVEINPF